MICALSPGSSVIETTFQRSLSVVGHVAGRAEDELERRQALLAIDDGVEGDRSRRVDDLLEDDRAEEVGEAVFLATVQAVLEDRLDVVPKRLPLTLRVPDVRAL